MTEQRFTWGGALRIIFDTVKESPAHLAEFYVDRDRTLVYRWLRDEAAPPAKLLPQIVRFVMENSVEAERVKIRSEMNAYLGSSSLDPGIRAALANEDGFEAYIDGVLRIALSMRRGGQADGGQVVPEEAQPAAASPRNLAVPLISVMLALVAAIVGGLAWNLLNRLFGWTYYMGGSGNEPVGWTAFVWGLTLGAPVIGCALLSLRVDGAPLKTTIGKGWVLSTLIYILTIGMAGLAFYNSGLRGFVEGLGLSLAVQETVIVVVYTTLLSLPPLLAMLALLRLPHIDDRLLAVLLLAPILISVFCVLGTMLVNRPGTEVEQLRGLVVGLTLRLSMFVAARVALSRSPQGVASSRLPAA